MIHFILALAFMAVSIAAVVMEKTYYYLPERELKRQAAHDEPLSRVLWRAVSYGSSLRVLLWSVLALTAAAGLVLLASVAPTTLAIVAVGLLLLLTFVWLPNTRLTHFGGRLTVAMTPSVVWLLDRLSPVLRLVQRQASRYSRDRHTGLYDREDLLEIIKRQRGQTDSRVTAEELDMLEAVLTFGQRKVREALTPRSKVKSVASSDEVGPILLDELHKSSHSRFPVHAANNNDNIVGTLCLDDLVKASKRDSTRGRVENWMNRDVTYLNEQDSLAEALEAFYQSASQLFVVVNNFNEYVGVVTLRDILAQLVGNRVAIEDKPANREEVAARHQEKSTEPAHETADAPAAEEPAIEAADMPAEEPTNDDFEAVEELADS